MPAPTRRTCAILAALLLAGVMIGGGIGWTAWWRWRAHALRQLAHAGGTAEPPSFAAPPATTHDGPAGATNAELLERLRRRTDGMELIVDHRQAAPGRRQLLAIWTDRDAAEAFRRDPVPALPPGTLVVKDRPHGGRLVAMLRRESGFDPAHADWEFIEADITAGAILQRGAAANCIACHDKARAHAFLFRTYLPAFATTDASTASTTGR